MTLSQDKGAHFVFGRSVTMPSGSRLQIAQPIAKGTSEAVATQLQHT
jgi:hypothetical protein